LNFLVVFQEACVLQGEKTGILFKDVYPIDISFLMDRQVRGRIKREREGGGKEGERKQIREKVRDR
jgi:hypothetical protein